MAFSFLFPSHFLWDTFTFVDCELSVCLISVKTLNYPKIHFSDNPEKHPFVSQKEFSKISLGKSAAGVTQNAGQRQPKIPWYRVFTKLPVWACCISAVCYIYAVQFNISFLVMYFAWIMKLPITVAGSVAALPLSIEFILQFFVGILSDRIKFLSEHTKVSCFRSVGFPMLIPVSFRCDSSAP